METVRSISRAKMIFFSLVDEVDENRSELSVFLMMTRMHYMTLIFFKNMNQ